MERLGRRVTLVIALVLSGISALCIWFVKTTLGTTLFACVFAGISVSAWNALDVLSVEVFPTSIRTSAFGMQAAIGRLGAIMGNLVFGALSQAHPMLPLTLAAIALCISGGSIIFLPNMTGRAIH